MHSKLNTAYETITIRGKTMSDAYAKVHRQVGSDAKVIHTTFDYFFFGPYLRMPKYTGR